MKLTRRLLQLGFLTLVLVSVFLLKGNAERWCPFGGVEAAYSFFSKGNMICSLGISNLYILGAVLGLTLLTRRSFCGYICPIGAISEFLQSGVRRLGLQPRTVPTGLDRGLSLLKYAVLAIILYFTITAGELLFRTADPCYALLSRHGADITFWAYIVSGLIVLGSLFILIPFCRWLCPLAAVLNVFSRFGFTSVRRHDSCVNCGKCSKACPMAIPVDKVEKVTAARCTSCLSCVESCPAKNKGALTWGPPQLFGKSWPQLLLVVLIFAILATAVAAAYLAPIASVTMARDTAQPAQTATLDLHIQGVKCRGSSTLLYFFLNRDDIQEIPGYLKVETWPSPDGFARVRLTYDPARAKPDDLKAAITEPYYVQVDDRWRTSPFQIEGYDPLALPE